MNTTADGLVIWEVKTGEADRVLTLLCGSGIITAYARGSLKPGGKLTASTALLSYSNFELASGKSMFTVADATLVKVFPDLRYDPEKIALAAYFCELLKLLAPVEDESAGAYLSLMLNSLYLMEKGNKPLWQIKAVFELLVMTYSGYMPDIMVCRGCGRERDEAAHFDPLSATWVCSECAARTGLRLNTGFSSVDAMRYVISCDPKKVYSFTLKETSVAEFAQCCEHFVLSHIDHSLPRLDFYHSLSAYKV